MRTRRRTRGAAALEAAVAIPVFVMLLGAAAFTVRLYASAAEARNEARHAAWAHALGACEEGGDGAQTADDSEGSPALEAALDAAASHPESELDGNEMTELENTEGAITEVDPDTQGTFVGDLSGQENLELGDSWGVARATIQGQTVRAGILAVDDVEPLATFEVQCNEKKRNAEILEVLGFLWNLHNTVVTWK